MKRALITGIRGQDGAYLASFLLKKGYEVIGADRRNGADSNWRLKELGIDKDVKTIYMDLLELTNIIRVLEKTKPDEIYNLAAQSYVAVSFEQPIFTSEVNAIGVARLLEAVRLVNPRLKFYQASSSEMFGQTKTVYQDENTPFYPKSPYGISKLFGHWTTVNYREAYDMFACCGICFNHESPLRGLEFVTRKITYSLAEIKYGLRERLILGNLEAKRDWGYAPEYVEAMWLMLQAGRADDYVVATGETHSVKEFFEIAAEIADFKIKWAKRKNMLIVIDEKKGKAIIKVADELRRPAEVSELRGNAQKIKKILGWQPQVKFEELVGKMMQADLRRLKNAARKRKTY